MAANNLPVAGSGNNTLPDRRIVGLMDFMNSETVNVMPTIIHNHNHNSYNLYFSDGGGPDFADGGGNGSGGDGGSNPPKGCRSCSDRPHSCSNDMPKKKKRRHHHNGDHPDPATSTVVTGGGSDANTLIDVNTSGASMSAPCLQPQVTTAELTWSVLRQLCQCRCNVHPVHVFFGLDVSLNRRFWIWKRTWSDEFIVRQ